MTRTDPTKQQVDSIASDLDSQTETYTTSNGWWIITHPNKIVELWTVCASGSASWQSTYNYFYTPLTFPVEFAESPFIITSESASRAHGYYGHVDTWARNHSKTGCTICQGDGSNLSNISDLYAQVHVLGRVV